VLWNPCNQLQGFVARCTCGKRYGSFPYTTCKTLPWRFMCATTCNLHDITECMKKRSKISKPSETFHEKMAHISILHNPPSNGNCKTWKERKQKKPTCWSVSPFLLCLKCSIYVLCTIHRYFPPSNTYMWWCHFPWIKGLPMLAHGLI